MTRLPFLDVRALKLRHKAEFHAALDRVLESGRFILGEELNAFEQEFARYCNVEHCVGVSNGLDALTLILRGLDIGAGQEVIVPSNTNIATWLAVSHAGATPVPVEPNLKTYNIAPQLIEASITPKTKAIIAVHLYGQPADMDSINDVAQRYGIVVIEDAAQAHGARYKGRRAGSLGRAAAFSFYPSKNLGALGDAGAITTSDRDLFDRLRALRNYASRENHRNVRAGFNARLDELQASFLRIELSSLEEDNSRRRRLAARLMKELSTAPLILPHVPDWAEPAWHLFVVRHSERDRLKKQLDAIGIETLLHYPVPPHRQGAYAGTPVAALALHLSEKIHREVISLPLHPSMSDPDLGRVIDAVRANA
jgi:dTDP-4-amino-4,6-dideoxygalactose transaminase